MTTLPPRPRRPGETDWVERIRTQTWPTAMTPPRRPPGRGAAMARAALALFDRVLDLAAEDERVRVVWMNGSRLDPEARRDPWMDFDIVFAVRDEAWFVDPARDWGAILGRPLLIQQTPEAMDLLPPDPDFGFGWLLQFEDGQRLDLTIEPLARPGDRGPYTRVLEQLQADRCVALLVDKEGLDVALPPPSDESYRIAAPSALHYLESCNEFWWVAPYVVKNMARGDWWNAAALIDEVLRCELLRQLTWRTALERGEAINPGKGHSRLARMLPAEERRAVWQTRGLGNAAGVSDAFAICLEQFRLVSAAVARLAGFDYPAFDARVTEWLPRYVDAGRFGGSG